MRNLVLLTLLASAIAAQGSTHLASRAPGGVQGNGYSGSPTLSTDGRFLCFQSSALNLTGDPAGNLQVVIKDLMTGTLEVMSRNVGGQPGNGCACSPGYPTDDGRYVGFSTQATNLLTVDANGSLADIFIRDRLTNTLELVSQSTGGVQANERCFIYDMTPDGIFVSITTLATNLYSGDTNGVFDVAVRDRLNGVTERISIGTLGTEPNGESRGGPISADGRYVLFDSLASNLVSGDSNGFRDVFLRDRLAGTTTRVSVGMGGAEANGISTAMGISDNGNQILIRSTASNLVIGDTNNVQDLFLIDLALGTTTLVHIGHMGQQATSNPNQAALSGDGRIVAFSSLANNLVPNDTNPGSDLFVHDTLTSETILATVNSEGVQGAIPCTTVIGSTTCGGQYLGMALSSDGRVLAFDHTGGVLIPDGADVNGSARDILIHEWSPRVDALGPAQVGQPLQLQFSARFDPGELYVAALSLGGLPGLRVGDRTVPLAPDQLFIASLTLPLPEIVGFSGLLDLNGQATGTLHIPNSPSLVGVTGYCAFVTVDFTTNAIRGISNAAGFTIGP